MVAAVLALGAACSSGSTPGDDDRAAPPTVQQRGDGADGDTASGERAGERSGRRKGKDKDREAAAACPSQSPPPGPAGHISLLDVTQQRGLDAPLVGMYGHAAAIGDVNGDGHVDIFVGGFGDRPAETYQVRGASGPAPDRLLLGGPDGFAVDGSFRLRSGRSSGAAFADLDGDGDPDLVVARNTRADSSESAGSDDRRNEAQSAGTVVLRNDDGHFEVATEIAAGVGARAVGIADFDGDRRLDLFISEDRWAGGSSVVLRNQGDLRFADVTDASGLPGDVHGLAATVADLSLDGIPDIFVAGSNRLFLNTGEGRFREADAGPFAWEYYGEEDDVAGVQVADMNLDGRPDLLLGQHFNSTVDAGCTVPVRLYIHQGVTDGEPVFEDVTDRAGLVGLPTKAPHVEVVDLDNDGWPDIVATASADDGDRPAVLRSLGAHDGVPRFTSDIGLGDERYWITGAVADFDDDGRVDVFVVDPDPARRSLLLRNESTSGHWLEVEMGLGPDELGTVVEVYRAGESDRSGALVGRQELVVGKGNAAGGSSRLHFGLGDETSIDVVVRPPRGGAVPELHDVAVDRRHCVGRDC